MLERSRPAAQEVEEAEHHQVFRYFLRLLIVQAAMQSLRPAKHIMIDANSAQEAVNLNELLTDEQVAELMADDIPPEYDVDYSKAKPNRFAKREAAHDVQDKLAK